MLKAFGFVIKMSLFAVAVWCAGEWVQWDGRTLSQHVRGSIARAGRSDTADYLKGMAQNLAQDARSGFEKRGKLGGKAQRLAASTDTNDVDDDLVDRTPTQAAAPAPNPAHHRLDEKLAPSERQKLRALIRELNSSPN